MYIFSHFIYLFETYLHNKRLAKSEALDVYAFRTSPFWVQAPLRCNPCPFLFCLSTTTVPEQMHRFFYISELWARTLKFDLDKKTLSAAARTCRVLKEPALDTLWADLNSLEPLLWLLGDMVTKQEPSVLE